MKNEAYSPEYMSPASAAFTIAMDGVARDIPELAEHRERALAGGMELVKDLVIAPEFFDEKLHGLFFGALADRNGRLEQEKSGMTVDEYTSEKTFIFNAAALLALDKSGLYTDFKSHVQTNEGLSDEVIEEGYRRFTNVQVTAELKRAIHEDGLLDSVRENLKITDSTEDPYELCVLNVAHPRNLYGMQPSAPLGDADNFVPPDGVMKQYLGDVDAFDGYAAGLVRNSDEFRGSVGMKGDLPEAWSFRLDNGKRYLCVSLPIAEKILYPEVRSDIYGPDHLQRDIAIVQHEYAHTQGGHMVDGKVFYGLGFEEFRAESASGNRHGYEDVKSFFRNDLYYLTGVYLPNEVRGAERGIDAERLYLALAKQVGLQAVLELALTLPGHYARRVQWHPMWAELQTYLGGYDGFSRRFYANATTERRAAIDRQVETWAELNKDNLGKDTWLRERKSLSNLHYMSDRMLAALQEARARN